MSALERKLSVKQLAEQWGLSIHEVYRLVHHADPAKRLPYVRIGGRIRFEESKLEAYLAAQPTREFAATPAREAGTESSGLPVNSRYVS